MSWRELAERVRGGAGKVKLEFGENETVPNTDERMQTLDREYLQWRFAKQEREGRGR